MNDEDWNTDHEDSKIEPFGSRRRKELEKNMKYHVHIYKIDSLAEINIEANSPEEARQKALDKSDK